MLMLPSLLHLTYWFVRDTARQAWAAGVTATLLAVTTAAVLFCLSIAVRRDLADLPKEPHEADYLLPKDDAEVRDAVDPGQGVKEIEAARADGVDVVTGEITFGFGAVRVPLTRNRAETVRYLQVVLGAAVADTAGVLLALVWTAGFLPTFLDPAAASVIWAKPPPRRLVLFGKAAGVVAVVFAQAFVFVAATWLALGARTGVWDAAYFLAVPLLVLHFAAFFGVSAVLAVLTRSPVACAVGTVAVWMACMFVNVTRHEAALAGSYSLDWIYWLLPKPFDLSLLMADALRVGRFFGRADQYRELVQPVLALATTFAVPAALMTAAGFHLDRQDY